MALDIGDDRREHPRVALNQMVQVNRLDELVPMMATDISAGGIFLLGCTVAIGEKITIEIEVTDVRRVRLRATVLVVRRIEGPGGGVGARFLSFEEGGSELARLIQFLLASK